MPPEALDLDLTLPPALRDERVVYGAVHLDVVDVQRSLAFWRDVVGLRELAAGSTSGTAVLGAGGPPLLVLHAGAERRHLPGHAGLYHLAIHVPDEVEFARVLVRLAHAGVPQSPTDHVMSKATYTRDPDGIMLELTLETPERMSRIEVGPRGVWAVDADGMRRGATEPLDVQAAIAPLAEGEIDLPLADGSYIGHVHLHVADLRAAHDFYRDSIGFREHAYMGPIGMADLGAGGRFPHRIALNDWNGARAVQPPPGTAGLRHFELLLRDRERVDALGTAGADGGVRLQDPSGNALIVRAAPLL